MSALDQLKKDLKTYFENMDLASEPGSRNTSVRDDRPILEKRLRDAVGLTMPARRY